MQRPMEASPVLDPSPPDSINFDVDRRYSPFIDSLVRQRTHVPSGDDVYVQAADVYVQAAIASFDAVTI